MKKNAFEYNENQSYLRKANMRLNGLRTQRNMNDSENLKFEYDRVQSACDDIKSKMTQKEFDDMYAHENRVLSPAEIAEEAKALIAKLAENRDSNSI